jgi:hypothetical protein
VYVGDIKGIQVFDSDGQYLTNLDSKGVAFGMVFNDKNELFVVARDRVIKYSVQPVRKSGRTWMRSVPPAVAGGSTIQPGVITSLTHSLPQVVLTSSRYDSHGKWGFQTCVN